jgi:hypothetical protein
MSASKTVDLRKYAPEHRYFEGYEFTLEEGFYLKADAQEYASRLRNKGDRAGQIRARVVPAGVGYVVYSRRAPVGAGTFKFKKSRGAPRDLTKSRAYRYTDYFYRAGRSVDLNRDDFGPGEEQAYLRLRATRKLPSRSPARRR